jgi:hypothetical protein
MHIIDKNLSFGSLSKRGATNKIIGHHADAFTCSVEDIHSWHKNNGWAGIGYHFLVRKDGQVYQGRPLDVLGAHTLNENSDSIGICLEGRLTQEKPTEAQINSLKELLSYIRGIYGNLPFKGHKDYMSTDCPGSLMEYMNELNGIQASNPSPASPQSQNTYNGYVAGGLIEQLQAEINKQFGKGLAVDGLIGPKTLAELPIVKQGAKGNITFVVQELLKKKGFNLNSDGAFGPITDSTVKQFQSNVGIGSDGIVGPITWKKLLEA